MARWRHCQIQVDTKRRIATVARPLLTRADARRAVTARAFSHARRLSEATGMATASNALYGVDVYSDSSEDSGNWESAGPRLSIGKRVDVSAPRKATENDLDAASVSSSDSEDDAMLVALVSAIACGADRPRVFDPYDPSRPDDSSGMARRGEARDSADDATDATAEDDDDEHSASSCSASSESEEVEETRPRRACFRTNPAPARTRTGSLGAIEVAFAATRPSPGGGRWGRLRGGLAFATRDREGIRERVRRSDPNRARRGGARDGGRAGAQSRGGGEGAVVPLAERRARRKRARGKKPPSPPPPRWTRAPSGRAAGHRLRA